MTPQPDPADKRLPSIMHYFSQVGNPAFPLSSLKARLSSSFSNTVTTATGSNVQSTLETVKSGEDGVFARVSSSSGANATHEHVQKPEKGETPETFNPTSLPTPPYSSACSLSQKDVEEMESTAPNTEKTAVSIYSALKDYMSSTTSSNVNESHSSRRPTCHPISSITDDSVLASHFSNPSLPDASDLPSTTDVPLLEHEKSHHTSKSSENLAKFTETVANASRLKNTPPLTPRALSNDNSTSSDRHSNGSTSAPSTSSNQRQTPTAPPSEESEEKPSGAVSPQTSSDGPTVASLKGSLSVKIDQGRGLRPSIDPYVVCVFEWNEYISKGTQSGEQTPEGKLGDKDYLDNDNGRPVAIPMKSRQSSHNSQLDNGDVKGKAPITDPKWNHEAVLYVLHTFFRFSSRQL
jgi:serine/threonine protein kinase SCH9